MNRRVIILLLAAILMAGCNGSFLPGSQSDSRVEFRVTGTLGSARIEHSNSGIVFRQGVVMLPYVYETRTESGSTDLFTIQNPSSRKGTLQLEAFVDGKLANSKFTDGPYQVARIRLKAPGFVRRTVDEQLWFIIFFGLVTCWLVLTFNKVAITQAHKGPSLISDGKENSRQRYLARVRDAIRRVE